MTSLAKVKAGKSKCVRGAAVCLFFVCVITLAFFGTACKPQSGQNDNAGGGDAGDLGVNVRRGVKPEADAEAVVFETDFGRIVIELYPNIAPQMVERFKTLVRSGFYDGTTFHRINPSLGIIQGGDPFSKDDNPANDGTGKSDFPNVPAEFSDIPYERGIVGAARATPPDSANSQFYITLIRQPAFDERYTVFGRVISGIDTAGIISNAQVRPGSENPADPIYLRKATLQPRSNFPGGK